MEPLDQQRLHALERRSAQLSQLADLLAETLNTTLLRLLALEEILQNNKALSIEELNAKAQALEETTWLEMEYTPDHENLCRLRHMLQEAEEQCRSE